MKKQITPILLAFALIAITCQTQAQTKKSIRMFDQVRAETQLTYSFFTGPDAADFTTSIKGFGSGILDFFGMRTSMDIIQIGSEKAFISVGAGLAVNKYRLAKNLIFGLSDENITTWAVDANPAHDYVNTFFGYGKSKIITTSFYFPVDVNLAIGKKLIMTAGGYLDLNLTARYKMKYLDGEDKVKEIIRSAEFRKFNPSTTKFGVNVSFLNKKTSTGISATYSLTPFFKTGMGPDIHEARISASYSIRKTKDPKKEKE